jgi:AcrR family transcriptional regulator
MPPPMAHARLLDIAIREFGAKGLDGASTRSIAAAAKTAMSSITYHYGGKEGLYLAAADRIAALMAETMTEARIFEEAAAAADPDEARTGIHRILGQLTDKMATDASGEWTLFVMREQMKPSAAFDRIYGGVMGQMVRTLALLVRLATGQEMREAQVATITLVGQVLALRASRATCLRLLERDTLDADDLARIKARIHANIDAILDSMRGPA